MKIAIKPTLLLLVPVIGFASCSQEDIPYSIEGNRNRIVFRTSYTDLTTRAEIVTNDNLTHFNVTAFDFDDPSLMSDNVMQTMFANEKVTIDDYNKTYTSPNCFWPDQTKERHKVSFFGFYNGPADEDGTTLVNTSTAEALDYKLTGFRVAPDISDQIDFITAYTTGSMANNLFSGIMLPFSHQLSRIEVKAYGAHKSCDIEIAGIRIGGVGTEGTFDFKAMTGGGVWEDNPARGIVEYVFHDGDKIIECGRNHRIAVEDAVSIMGQKREDGNDNCAMLIPGAYAMWDFANDPRNNKNQMYISVLLRVTDATPTAGINPEEKQRYPYRDLSQGADALNVPVVYLAVDKATATVASRVYKNGDGYFSDAGFTVPYIVPDTMEIKEFGWAAIPVKVEWQPGKIYTYTLDYTLGVGIHDPEVSTVAPGAGDPVISDKVGFSYTVKEWNDGGGDEFVAPGS